MAVEDPGTLTVTCDGCGETVDMATTEYAGDTPIFGVDISTLSENEWSVAGAETFCPDCSLEEPEDG